MAELVGDLAGADAGLVEAVATVLRKVCKVTQSNPMRSKRRRSSAVVLERLRTLPSGEGKRTSSVLMAECLPIPLGRRPSHDE
ncbi:MAG: hypothetical protein ABWX84_00335 [Nocardioides sp.]